MDEPAPMSAKMRRFLAKSPKRLSPERIAARRSGAVRRSKPKGWLAELCEVQRWRCAYCNRAMRKKPGPMQATLDHALPVSRGGRNQWSNLCAACHTCNQAKGSLTAEEFRAASGEVTFCSFCGSSRLRDDGLCQDCGLGRPASGMSTGTAKTPQAVEGQSPASPVGEAETPKA